MSAFICSVKTKSAVAALIDREAYNPTRTAGLFWSGEKFRKVIDEYAGKNVDEWTPDRLQIIYNMLDDLNSANVFARYKRQEQPAHEKVIELSQKNENLFTVETFKRLACLIYQCGEDASDTEKFAPVFEMLKTFENALAKYLIMQSKEFDDAEGWE